MKKCIDSLLVGGEDVEIIIVDDGSAGDRTAEIADEYAAEYPSVVKALHKKNGGHGSPLGEMMAVLPGKDLPLRKNMAIVHDLSALLPLFFIDKIADQHVKHISFPLVEWKGRTVCQRGDYDIQD